MVVASLKCDTNYKTCEKGRRPSPTLASPVTVAGMMLASVVDFFGLSKMARKLIEKSDESINRWKSKKNSSLVI